MLRYRWYVCIVELPADVRSVMRRSVWIVIDVCYMLFRHRLLLTKQLRNSGRASWM